ncbi:MAG: VCBS repeat-containing protein [Chthonomonadales bacterium]|nr:VCBS repeat-containing protein [Chthonomonadales bacterium]
MAKGRSNVRIALLAALVAAVGLCAVQAAPSSGAPREVRFRRVVLDKEFRAEGAAVADVNRDGKLDVLAGNLWYEAPDWAPHEIAPVKRYDGATGYSNCFACFAIDVDRDSWPDQVVLGMPGDPAVWRRNPGRASGHWQEFPVCRSACNETPLSVRVGSSPRLLLACDERQMAWLEPGGRPEQGFAVTPIGEADGPGVQRFSHGLGLGDLNGDRRPDVLTSEGYYLAPARVDGEWQTVRRAISPPCANMHALDVNGDGLADVLCSSAHGYGVWWLEQRRGGGGPEFVQHVIDDTISQTHALMLADIDGDGRKDLVTGKRFWAHGPKGDPGSDEPAILCWYRSTRVDGGVAWERHDIDGDSGVGTQFEVTDVNGDRRPDIVVANKKGVFVFLQER